MMMMLHLDPCSDLQWMGSQISEQSRCPLPPSVTTNRSSRRPSPLPRARKLCLTILKLTLCAHEQWLCTNTGSLVQFTFIPALLCAKPCQRPAGHGQEQDVPHPQPAVEAGLGDGLCSHALLVTLTGTRWHWPSPPPKNVHLEKTEEGGCDDIRPPGLVLSAWF